MVGVALGMPGPWADDNYEASDHYTTKIGGVPDWPIPEMDIRNDLLECNICGNRLCLVVQVHAPITMDGLSIDDRAIYVLGCVTLKCGNNPASWHALRLQKFSNAMKSSMATVEVASTVSPHESTSRSNWWERGLLVNGFSDKDDDDGDEDFEIQELGRALSEAASLASHSKKQNGSISSKDINKGLTIQPSLRKKNACGPVVPCFYIIYKETSSIDVNGICAGWSSISIKDNDSHADDQIDEETWNEEQYEYDKALNADRTYLKFKKQVDKYPDQCIRYSLGGQPLLAYENLGDPGVCSNCGAARRYEMQLMPALLYFLQQSTDNALRCALEDWNWTTLMVYTCSQNCTVASDSFKSSSKEWGMVEEGLIIQDENSSHDLSRLSFFS